jgi:hypothetical protein
MGSTIESCAQRGQQAKDVRVRVALYGCKDTVKRAGELRRYRLTIKWLYAREATHPAFMLEQDLT